MKILKVLIYVGLLASCAMGQSEISREYGFGSGLSRIDVSAEIEGEDIVEVKSVLSAGVESRVTDLTLASYDADGHLVDVVYYESFRETMSLLVESSGGSIYALANMGDMSGIFPLSESNVCEIEYHVESYSEVEAKGFPMSGKLTDYSLESGRAVIKLQRLFAKLRVRITHKSLAGYSPSMHYAYNLCNKSMFIRQANSRILPFSVDGSKAVKAADIMGVSDGHQNLNDRSAYQGSLSQSEIGPGPGYLQDTTLVLYVPENVQGRLLPQNKDPYAKDYGAISDVGGKSYSELCTYLEFNARRENTQGYSGDVMYRYYLGADNTSDFSLERNKRYDITLDFTEDGFFSQSWKVSRGDDWKDGRILEFSGEPYLINPGGTARMLIHYHRSGRVQADSQIYPDDWDFHVDDDLMMDAGVSYSFDPSALVMDDDGFARCCVNLVADADAEVGRIIPVKIISRDGSLADESSVTVVARSELSPVWDFCPEYVSQEGLMYVTGATKDDLPLSVSLADPSKVSCSRVGDDAFKIIAKGTGKVHMVISNVSGTKMKVVSLDIKAPGLMIDGASFTLNPDGEGVAFNYSYVDVQGNLLQNVNASAFDTYLRPILSAESYFNVTVTSSTVKVYVSSLKVAGAEISLGKSYEAVLAAADCPDVTAKSLRLVVKNPFKGISVKDFGKVHDYTLFVSNDVDPLLRTAFSEGLKANSSFEYQGFVPDADSECIAVALEPAWTDGFSFPNEVFKATLDQKNSMIKLSSVTVSSSTRHSAGKHRMMVYVANRHSGEKIGACCGEIDLYVHTAIGARAIFGSQKCGWKPSGNETFASVYNYIAARSVYPSVNSASLVSYMDVSMEWMTDVSKVYVWDRMSAAVQSGMSWMDALDVVRPSVLDGELNSNTRMMYSVMTGSDSRISVCGEKYGPRKGIGGILYRALLVSTTTSALSDIDLRRFFLGYDTSVGKAASAFAPCYTLHDMNRGSDMRNNIVVSRAPYYFLPSSCPECADDEGKGYHVIHFLEEISPETCGWINLL